MSSVILITISILALIKIARDGLFYLWLWQIKEYRTDRMRAYLRDERNIVGKNTAYFVGIVLILIFYFNQAIFTYLVLIFFTFTFYQILIEIKNKTLKRPKFTFRILVTLFTIIVLYLIVAFSWIPAFAGMTRGGVVNIETAEVKVAEIILLLLFFYLITPILISLIILFTNPFFNFQKKRIIKKAAGKMRGLKKIKVIGITGSYGKTSTKEFLYTILNERYKVVRTEGNNNTNIGVARTVLNKVNDNYDYFICEMGAYKIGEIAEICGIAKPEIGILTGINEQHLDLFGSIENTIKAKFELIEALPEKGLAIINSSIKYQVSNIKVENIKYFSLGDVDNIKVYSDCVEFIYKDQNFNANFLGRHYIENLLAAIITAENLGMNLEEISEAVKKIKSSKFMMRKLDGLNNSIFIDDSYSANPDGVIAALNYLDEAYQGYRKIIVFPGIIELGNRSEEVHRELFDKISGVCDIAYILETGKLGNWEAGNKCKFVFEKDFNKVARMLKNNLNEKTVVLFESRGAGVVMGKI